MSPIKSKLRQRPEERRLGAAHQRSSNYVLQCYYATIGAQNGVLCYEFSSRFLEFLPQCQCRIEQGFVLTVNMDNRLAHTQRELMRITVIGLLHLAH